MQPGNRKAILAALVANLGLALAKFAGWATTGAASMLAEAVHSFADSGNQALLLWGAASAQRPETEDHPFGFARERYFWAFVVSLIIFALGSLFSIYQGIHRLLDPQELESPMVAITILAAGIAMEGLSFRTAAIETAKQKKQLGWWAFIRQTKNPELPVILLEDLGALLGLVLALLGIGLTALTGEPRFDAIGSITIGLLLGVIAGVLAIEMRSLLIGEAASPQNRRAIRQSLSEAPSVERVIHMRTQHFGPDQLLVALKVQFRENLSSHGIADGINDAERRIRERVPAATLIFIEPDIYQSGKREVGADP